MELEEEEKYEWDSGHVMPRLATVPRMIRGDGWKRRGLHRYSDMSRYAGMRNKSSEQGHARSMAYGEKYTARVFVENGEFNGAAAVPKARTRECHESTLKRNKLWTRINAGDGRGTNKDNGDVAIILRRHAKEKPKLYAMFTHAVHFLTPGVVLVEYLLQWI